MVQGNKKRLQISSADVFAEEEGFEPPVPFSTTVFKTAPLNHSGTPPKMGGAKVGIYLYPARAPAYFLSILQA
jgi:hypothetical protein